MKRYLKSSVLIIGLTVTSLSSGFAHAYNPKQTDSDSKSAHANVIEGGANFVINHPNLSLFLATAPYLISNRAIVVEGAKYGAKLAPFSWATQIAISQLLPEYVANKTILHKDDSPAAIQAIYLGPIIEEVLFRGIIQNVSMIPARFLPMLTEPLLLLNACLFGGVHAVNEHSAAYVQAISIALIGYAAGFTRSYHSHSLGYTVGMHMAYNAIATLSQKLISDSTEKKSK